MSGQRKIRVLVVDDSAVVRRMISDALGQDAEIEVVGTACDPYVARDLILQLEPDVLTLDIEMPRMDGLTFLKILQQHRPMPVVIVSSLTPAGSKIALRALELGAVDVVAKQSSAWNIGSLRDQLAHRIKGAARARLSLLQPSASTAVTESSAGLQFSPRQLVVIGASTGGTEAVKSVLTRLPAGLPGICIVQHIPPVFSRTFAERLDECCALEVREAAHGDEVLPGTALIAPGDYHMAVEWTGNRYRIRLRQDPPIHFTRPAVDMLFNSAAQCAGRHALGVLLTGMGRDGAQGMQQLKAAGAVNLAQNEATCVVYGMPKAAVELGVVDRSLPLDHIPHAIIQALREAPLNPAAAAAPRN
ncbi:MAG: chemotaxis response regulator protein-glutamate methylesterase [Verrucomicrobiota bacterium]|jgi:two-component system chemotaxis response regulator CheB